MLPGILMFSGDSVRVTVSTSLKSGTDGFGADFSVRTSRLAGAVQTAGPAGGQAYRYIKVIIEPLTVLLGRWIDRFNRP